MILWKFTRRKTFSVFHHARAILPAHSVLMAFQSAVVYGRLLASHARQFVAPLLIKETCPSKLHLISACCGFSKDFQPAKSKFVFGEDAYFVAGTKHSDVLGVADGVGGWRQYGIDSSLFSSALMESCKRFVLEGGLESSSPINIVKAGFQDLTEHKEPLFGSSTACIMVLDKKSQMLHSSNLGDSGFLVIRQGSIVHQSSEQQHYFNTPYQLAIPPPGQAGAVIQDSLDEAESTSFSVELGDLIVLATDGLFDNVSTEQILNELSQLEDHSSESIQRVTDSLANLARAHSFDPTFSSPFSEQARCEGFNIIGGKPDDITVLIAVVSEMGDDSDT